MHSNSFLARLLPLQTIFLRTVIPDHHIFKIGMIDNLKVQYVPSANVVLPAY